MSEKETKGASGASLVMMEKTRSSKHKPYRPTDLEDSTPVVHHKRSKPAVHSAVADELKNVEELRSSDYDEKERIQDSDNEAMAVSSKVKHKLLHRSSKQKSIAEAIPLAELDATAKRAGVPSQPIPSSQIDLSPSSVKVTRSNESIADIVTDLEPTATGINSEDEDAGGLSRGGSRASLASGASRASRVGRVMRRMLCCSVMYEAPSEECIAGRPERSGI